MSDEPNTIQRMAVRVDDATGKASGLLSRLPDWAKVVAAVGFFLTLLSGAVTLGQAAYNAVEGFGPLETQFRTHRGDFQDHVEVFVDHEIAHQGEHGEFHALEDTLLQSFIRLNERMDTVFTRQRWIMCMDGQVADRENGVPVRDCTPFGGAP